MLENARQEIASLTEEKKLFIMGLNNTLANLRVSNFLPVTPGVKQGEGVQILCAPGTY